MNYWILGLIGYLIAVLCVFAFIRGASGRGDSETAGKDDPKEVGLGQCRLKKLKA